MYRLRCFSQFGKKSDSRYSLESGGYFSKTGSVPVQPGRSQEDSQARAGRRMERWKWLSFKADRASRVRALLVTGYQRYGESG